MKVLFAVLIVVTSILSIQAQQIPTMKGNGIRSHTLVLKLKSNYIQYAQNDGITNQEYSDLSQSLQVTECKKLFPLHHPLEVKFNKDGDRLIDLSLIYQIKYENSIDEYTASSFLRKCGIFEYVEPRPDNTFFYAVNDEKVDIQYYLKSIKAFSAWDIEKGDTNVIIGIIDNGTDRIHEDMKKNLYFNYLDTIDGVDNDNDGYIDNFYGWDLGSNDNDPQWYPYGHGVFVSGITSATQNNGIGIAGIAYNNKYMAIKADDTSGFLTHDYEGIIYAADHGCSIINCSWGGVVGGQFGQDIVDYATFNKNALVVAAAGNYSEDYLIYPAAYKYVIGCGATDSLDNKAGFSAFGKHVDICAPGSFIYSTFVNNMYVYSHGTSFSAPCVVAGAALLKSKYPWMSALMLGEQLKVTADKIDTIAANSMYIDRLGSGRLNIYNALVDTTKPSIVLKEYNKSISTDTVTFTATFKNYLHATSSYCKAIITSNSPFLSSINDEFIIGSLNMLDTIQSIANPFQFKILPGMPIGHQVEFMIRYLDTNYSGFEYFTLYFNEDILSLDTNMIDLSICSNSSLGFVDDRLEIGKGMLYQNNPKTLFSCGGLVVGNSLSKVSDNIYEENGRSNSFRPLVSAKYVLPSTIGDQEIYCQYNDDSATFTSLKISVAQRSYSFTSSNLKKSVFLDYTIKNNGINTLNLLYAGLYIDWDLNRSEFNHSTFDATLNMSYTYSTFGGNYCGIILLKGDSVYPYNFNNDGSDNSLNITDGFLDFEKYQALQTSRHNAGFSTSTGKDVSSLLSSGPYSVSSGDSIQVVYALVVGDHLADLKLNAKNVRDYYYNSVGISEKSNLNNLICIPNPFKNRTDVYFTMAKSEHLEITITDLNGKIVQSISNKLMMKGENKISIQTDNLNRGIYVLQLKSASDLKTLKLVKTE